MAADKKNKEPRNIFKAQTERIKQSLLKHLKSKGADIEHFTSLVDDYVWFWIQEREMQKDVKTMGRNYKAISAQGKLFDKENPSVKNALLYNKQKLAILKELELSTNNVVSDDDGEEL